MEDEKVLRWRHVKTSSRPKLCAGKWRNFWKNSAFHKLKVVIELIFLFIFQFSIFILRKPSKVCLIFSYVIAVFEKSAMISRQELSFDHILNEYLISKDLQIIWKKKQKAFLSAFIWNTPPKIIKQYCNAFGTWSSPSATHYNHLKK